MARLIDADALYNGAMKDEYFDFVSHDNHGRESFAYSCAMQRLSEAPAVDAIPVEWLEEKANGNDFVIGRAARFILRAWEQEAQDG